MEEYTKAYKDKFMSDLVEFVADDDFQNQFEGFFIKYAIEFTQDEEHQLRYYEIYQEFHEMFESKLLDFCDFLKISQVEFMKRCKAASEDDTKAKHYINILLSSVEYETFVRLMRIMRPVAEQKLHLKADTKNPSSKPDNKPNKSVTSKASMKSEDEDDDFEGDEMLNENRSAGAKPTTMSVKQSSK